MLFHSRSLADPTWLLREVHKVKELFVDEDSFCLFLLKSSLPGLCTCQSHREGLIDGGDSELREGKSASGDHLRIAHARTQRVDHVLDGW